MRGARGDAARRAEAAQATTSQSAFGDYVKFDDMFGASCIFTTGDPEQVQRQREAYVQQTMARKLYGYVHRLETHGAPIQRVVVGGGCEAAENKGRFPTSRPRDETAGALHADALANDDPLASRKRARVAGHNVGGRAGGVSPAARGGVAPQWGARALDGPGARLGTDGSLANLFEQSLGEDWEPMDPLWAAMDSLATPGSVGGVGGPLEDPCSALLPGALSKGAATEEDLMRRARIELIEERLHSLEHALASERAPKRSDTAAGAGGSGGSDKSNAFVRSGDVPESGTRARGGLAHDDVVELSPATNLFQRGLFVDTGRLQKKASGRSSGDASDKSGGGGSGVGGKSPQSPSPLHRAPPDRSRSRSRSDERGTAHTRPKVSARWNEAAHFGVSEPTPMAVSGGAAPSAEFPEVVPDDGAFAGGAFAGGFAGDGGVPREPHKVSTSFTSTPGGARGGAPGSGLRGADVGVGESPRSAARRLARENAALAEERRRAKQERDLLLAEHEHNKAQAALLQASNAQYERRVAQLEALVRENTHSRPISFARTNTLGTRAAEEARGETVARPLGVIETFVPDEALVERVERSSFEKNVSDGRPGEPASFETEKIETRAAEDVAEKTSSGVEGVMSG